MQPNVSGATASPARHGKDCLASGADSEMAAGMPYDAIAVSSDLKV